MALIAVSTLKNRVRELEVVTLAWGKTDVAEIEVSDSRRTLRSLRRRGKKTFFCLVLQARSIFLERFEDLRFRQARALAWNSKQHDYFRAFIVIKRAASIACGSGSTHRVL